LRGLLAQLRRRVANDVCTAPRGRFGLRGQAVQERRRTAACVFDLVGQAVERLVCDILG